VPISQKAHYTGIEVPGGVVRIRYDLRSLKQTLSITDQLSREFAVRDVISRHVRSAMDASATVSFSSRVFGDSDEVD
jgi:hypothetical protein